MKSSTNKSKIVLSAVAVFVVAVSAGSYQYYKNNVKPISMSFTDAHNIYNLYVQQKVCASFGLVEIKPEHDLFPVVSRIEIINLKEQYPDADKDKAMLNLDMVQKTVDDKVKEVKARMDEASSNGGFNFFKNTATCEQSLYKAKNVVSNLKVEGV